MPQQRQTARTDLLPVKTQKEHDVHSWIRELRTKSWSFVYTKHPCFDRFVRHLNGYFRGPIVKKFWISILSFVFVTALLRFQVRWADIKGWPLIGWRESEHPQRSRDSCRLCSDFRISHTVLFFHPLSRRLQHFVHCCNKQTHTEKNEHEPFDVLHCGLNKVSLYRGVVKRPSRSKG